MGNYFLLQCKRVLRFLPLLICVVLILFYGISAVFDAMVQSDRESEEKTRFRVGLTGSAEENLFNMGVVALETFDDSRFTLEVCPFDGEEAALDALRKRDVVAVVVVPEGFVADSLQGNMPPLKFITFSGNTGLVSMFRDEITEVISGMLVSAQKGVYGSYDLFAQNGQKQDAQALMDQLNIEYIELVLARSHLYSAEEVGVGDSLDFASYLFCGISVLLLFLVSLPFALLFVRQDLSLGRVLAARRFGAFAQVGAEFAAMLAGMAVLFVTVLLALSLQNGESVSSVLSMASGGSAALNALPVLLSVTAFGFFLFEIARDLISGVLLHFFLSLSLCYVSGCLYPIYTFPEGIQQISSVLPTGIARAHLASCITDQPCASSGIWLLLYGVLFFFGAVSVRYFRLRRGRS